MLANTLPISTLHASSPQLESKYSIYLASSAVKCLFFSTHIYLSLRRVLLKWTRQTIFEREVYLYIRNKSQCIIVLCRILCRGVGAQLCSWRLWSTTTFPAVRAPPGNYFTDETWQDVCLRRSQRREGTWGRKCDLQIILISHLFDLISLVICEMYFTFHSLLWLTLFLCNTVGIVEVIDGTGRYNSC